MLMCRPERQTPASTARTRGATSSFIKPRITSRGSFMLAAACRRHPRLARALRNTHTHTHTHVPASQAAAKHLLDQACQDVPEPPNFLPHPAQPPAASVIYLVRATSKISPPPDRPLRRQQSGSNPPTPRPSPPLATDCWLLDAGCDAGCRGCRGYHSCLPSPQRIMESAWP